MFSHNLITKGKKEAHSLADTTTSLLSQFFGTSRDFEETFGHRESSMLVDKFQFFDHIILLYQNFTFFWFCYERDVYIVAPDKLLPEYTTAKRSISALFTWHKEGPITFNGSWLSTYFLPNVFITEHYGHTSTTCKICNLHLRGCYRGNLYERWLTT